MQYPTKSEAAAMAAESRGCRPAAYSRRHPEQTVLYHVVQQHLEAYLMLACEGDWDGHAVPAYVERDFRRYLECGILTYGFARAYCAECGHDFFVAFSCKGRGICPSCNMAIEGLDLIFLTLKDVANY